MNASCTRSSAAARSSVKNLASDTKRAPSARNSVRTSRSTASTGAADAGGDEAWSSDANTDSITSQTKSDASRVTGSPS
jgi:hypothetical protein